MDVQGSQYHLLRGEEDWARCVDSASGRTLGSLWHDEDEALPSATPTSLQYDADMDVLRLHRDTPLFRRAGRTLPLPESNRRGAGRDGYGNWYWIDDDRTSIRWLPTDDTSSTTWWRVSDQWTSCADAAGADFATCAPTPRPGMVLQGLTVTTRHYLLAGYLYPGAPGSPRRADCSCSTCSPAGSRCRCRGPAVASNPGISPISPTAERSCSTRPT